MDAASYLQIIRGSDRGFAAELTRGLLSMARVPYCGAVLARNCYYDRAPSAVRRVPVPVISVGNVTLGGTGKTPLVAWLADWIRAQGLRVAIVSRGYKARSGQANDEALELDCQLTDVPHVQDPNRYRGACLAIQQFASQVILLDDGFQHRRLHRNLDIVLLDALQPFGLPAKLFPRGTLREPISGLQRAGVLVLTRADQVLSDERERIEHKARQFAPHAVWSTGTHTPAELQSGNGLRQPLDTLVGRRVYAFCGIGNPTAFRRTLQACGCQIVGFQEFPDHHQFGPRDLEQVSRAVQQISDVDLVVCTMKDLVKLRTWQLGTCPLYALVIRMCFEQGWGEVERQLARSLSV